MFQTASFICLKYSWLTMSQMCSKVTQFYIDIYSFFKFLSIKGTSNWILFLCYSPLFIYFIYNSMHLLILNAQSILPPFSFDNRKFAYFCADTPALYHFSDYIHNASAIGWSSSLSELLHLGWLSLGPSNDIFATNRHWSIQHDICFNLFYPQ